MESVDSAQSEFNGLTPIDLDHADVCAVLPCDVLVDVVRVARAQGRQSEAWWLQESGSASGRCVMVLGG